MILVMRVILCSELDAIVIYGVMVCVISYYPTDHHRIEAIITLGLHRAPVAERSSLSFMRPAEDGLLLC